MRVIVLLLLFILMKGSVCVHVLINDHSKVTVDLLFYNLVNRLQDQLIISKITPFIIK